MTYRWVISLIIMITILGGGYVFTAQGQGGGIVVNDANATWQASLNSSTSLFSNLTTVSARILAQYTKAVVQHPLIAMPSGFQTQLDQTAPHTALHYANANKTYNLTNVPTTLGGLLQQVSNRIAFNYVDASLTIPLSYPKAVVKDSQPPQPTTPVKPTQPTGTTIVLTVITNEFSSYIIEYRLKSGGSPQTQTSDGYHQTHTITLNNLTAESTYTYKITLQDRSGNPRQLTGNFTVAAEVTEQSIYLPLVVR